MASDRYDGGRDVFQSNDRSGVSSMGTGARSPEAVVELGELEPQYEWTLPVDVQCSRHHCVGKNTGFCIGSMEYD